jgi:hypothetical protein
VKRFRRWVLNGLCAVLLLLLVITAAVWIRSKTNYDRFYVGGYSYAFWIAWDEGRINSNLKLCPSLDINHMNRTPWTHLNNKEFSPTDPHDDPSFGLVTVNW